MSEILSPTHRSPQMPTLLWHTEQLTTNSYFEWRNAIDTGPHWLSPNYFTTILADENRTRLLLKLLKERGNGVFRTYAERASSIGLGYYSDFNLDYDDLKDHLDELAGYCPNIVEISCARVNTQFSDFRELSSPQAETKLITFIPRRKFQEAGQAKLLRSEPRSPSWIRLLLAIDYPPINPVHPTTSTPESRFLSLPPSFVLRLRVRQLPPIDSPTTTSDCISYDWQRMVFVTNKPNAFSLHFTYLVFDPIVRLRPPG
jgi:hypothetical protein